jgi:CBS domain-containing protein
MATVRDLLARKGHEVVSLPPSATVLQAAQVMNEHGIGAVVVLEGTEVRGIFTERDVLRRVVAAERPAHEVTIADVMTTGLATCGMGTSVEECAELMTARRIRHLPVVDDDGALTGLVSIGDVVARQVAEQRGLIEELNRYIYDVR